ncbi:hypothetical protein HK405_007598, partial [Cladochytrium tenue]
MGAETPATLEAIGAVSEPFLLALPASLTSMTPAPSSTSGSANSTPPSPHLHHQDFDEIPPPPQPHPREGPKDGSGAASFSDMRRTLAQCLVAAESTEIADSPSCSPALEFVMAALDLVRGWVAPMCTLAVSATRGQGGDKSGGGGGHEFGCRYTVDLLEPVATMMSTLSLMARLAALIARLQRLVAGRGARLLFLQQQLDGVAAAAAVPPPFPPPTATATVTFCGVPVPADETTEVALGASALALARDRFGEVCELMRQQARVVHVQR